MKTNYADFNLVHHIASCPTCKDIAIITINQTDYEAWLSGTMIQDAFPYLSVEDRERLLSGYCPDCWDWIFGEDE